MNRIDLFNNLMVMAAVDGKITTEEAQYLASRAVQWGISEEEAKRAIQNAVSNEKQFSVPATKPERLELLRELIMMMAIDGELATIEKALCAHAAVQMDITPAEFKQVLASFGAG